MLKFKKRVLIYSYDERIFTQEQIIQVEMEMYSDVANRDKQPGTIYQDKEGHFFVFDNCEYNAKEGVITYYAHQIIEVKKSNIIVPNLVN